MCMRLMNPRRAAGFALLECLFAMLIFTVGILALVTLHAKSIYQSMEAKRRVDASLLANELIGQMWISDRSTSALAARFAGTGTSAGAAYTAWLAEVASTLPGTTSYPPTVTVATSAALAGSMVTIQLYWKAPTEAPGDPAHRYTVTAQITSSVL